MQPAKPTGTTRDGLVVEPTARSGKVLVAAFIAFAIGVSLYFALGMPGMNHGSGSSMDGMDMTPGALTHRLVDPVAFATALAQPNAIMINVQSPYHGEIDGTDLFMPFDRIDAAALPSARETPLLVYGTSNTMSAQAVATLAGLGYTNIVELDGGMNVWRASGRSITIKPSSD